MRAGLTPAPLEGAASRMRVFGMSDPDGNLLWLFELPGGVPDLGIYSGYLCQPVRSFTNGGILR